MTGQVHYVKNLIRQLDSLIRSEENEENKAGYIEHRATALQLYADGNLLVEVHSNDGGSVSAYDGLRMRDADEGHDVMRKKYRHLTEEEQAAMAALKDMGEDFCNFVHSLGNTRELALARTKMEEAVMWAVKHLTK